MFYIVIHFSYQRRRPPTRAWTQRRRLGAHREVPRTPHGWSVVPTRATTPLVYARGCLTTPRPLQRQGDLPVVRRIERQGACRQGGLFRGRRLAVRD